MLISLEWEIGQKTWSTPRESHRKSFNSKKFSGNCKQVPDSFLRRNFVITQNVIKVAVIKFAWLKNVHRQLKVLRMNFQNFADLEKFLSFEFGKILEFGFMSTKFSGSFWKHFWLFCLQNWLSLFLYLFDSSP